MPSAILQTTMLKKLLGLVSVTYIIFCYAVRIVLVAPVAIALIVSFLVCSLVSMSLVSRPVKIHKEVDDSRLL